MLGERYRQLDSLRGLAALTVFLSHTLGLRMVSQNTSGFSGLISRILDHTDQSILHIFYDGGAAVDLFFV